MADHVFNVGDTGELVSDHGNTFDRVLISSRKPIDGNFRFGVQFLDHKDKSGKPFQQDGVLAESLRPQPPELHGMEIEPKSVVECFIKGSWCVGVVESVLKNGKKDKTTYMVRSLANPNERPQPRSVVRISQVYKAGRANPWVVARNAFN